MKLTETFAWNGREIAWGKAGSGPPVVFCHGTPFSSLLWHPFADELSRDYTVYIWDMPGYGASSKKPEHPVDFGVQADAFQALLEHWGIERPHVIAHDFGAAVALRAYLIGGVKYSSLMLLDAVAIPPIGSPFFKYVQNNRGLLEQLPSFIHSAVVAAYIKGASYRDLTDNELDTLVQPWTGELGQPAFYRQIADFDIAYLEENQSHLGEFDIPVSILWGAEDEWIPAEIGEEIRAKIPGATLTYVPNAGHLIQYDAPIALADQFRSWLTQQSAQG